MPDQPRRRYRVRLRKALAGSVFAAATAASLTGFGAAPALAAPTRVVSASSAYADDAARGLNDVVLGADTVSSAGGADLTTTAYPATSDGERLAGVRADLDRAVLLRLVTSEQANAFYAQIERRVAAGL